MSQMLAKRDRSPIFPWVLLCFLVRNISVYRLKLSNIRAELELLMSRV